MKEWARAGLAAAGVALWLGFPFVWSASLVVRLPPCRTEQISDCNIDYLPIVEVVAYPIMLLTAFGILKLALVLCAPPPGERTLRWPMTPAGSTTELWPLPHGLGALLALWAVWHSLALGLTVAAMPFQLYWVAWIVWVAAALMLAWPRRPVTDLPLP